MNSLKSAQPDARDPVYAFGPFRLDPTQRLLTRDGEPVTLTPRTLDLLLLLVRERGRVVGKTELLEALWPDVAVEENNLMQQISTLRKALGESTYIRTVPGHGYRFVGECRTGFSPSGRAKARPTFALIVIGAIAIVVAAYFALRPKPSTNIHSIAVLPFKAIGGREDEYLGLGMSDVLITRLSNAHAMIVRPTSAVRRFANQDQDALAAGRELKVDSVLEGTIQRHGNDVRVTVRLLDVAKRRPLWGETFDERFTNLFAVEDSIASRLARSLALQLSQDEMKRLTHRDTTSAEAHQLYLKGRYYSGVRTPDAFQKALDSFQKAIAIDPAYALAYDGLADAYYRESSVHLSLEEAVPKARAAAVAALQIDDSLPDAHATLGVIKFRYEWNRRDAERELRHAIALNRNCVTAHQWYSELLVASGRADESVREARLAQQIDPLSPEVGWNVGFALLLARRPAEAANALRDAVKLNPNFWLTRAWLAFSLGESGKFDEAFAEYARSLSIDDNADTLSHMAYVYARAGRQNDARRIAHELVARSEREYVSPFYLASCFVAAGDKNRCLIYLQKALEEHSEFLVFLKVAPNFEAVRDDPRFLDLERKVGLNS